MNEQTEPRDTEQGAPSDEDAVSRKGTGGHGPDCPTGGGAPAFLERLEALGRAPEPFALLHEWPWLYDELKRLTAEVERLRAERCYICRPNDSLANAEGCSDCEEKAELNAQITTRAWATVYERAAWDHDLKRHDGADYPFDYCPRCEMEHPKGEYGLTRQRLHEIEEAARECVVGYDWCALPITVESATGGPEETACGDCAPCRLRALLERSPDGE